ncbi:MAG: DNA recombination protein RmuC, partial [Deltaproteobacteria bacterium]|nr:DNA recombination protein RmuC [Deltaproteobacteria bacterium]
VQLRRVVELAGLADHVDFDEQASTESGRPDMIVRLPQGGVLPVDAKVPLGAFLDAMEAEDDQSRKSSLVLHEPESILGTVRDSPRVCGDVRSGRGLSGSCFSTRP